MTFRLKLLSPKNFFEDELAVRLQDAHGFLENVSLTLFSSSGIALITSDEEMHHEATQYLLEKAVWGKGLTIDTVRTYGESLVVYLNYLSRHHMRLKEVSELTLYQYKSFLINNEFNRRLTARTINLRISTVCRFHEWAQRTDVFFSPLGMTIAEQRYSFKRWSLRAFQQRAKWAMRHDQRIPRVLNLQEIRTLIQAARTPFSLMFKWALVAGLRRFEICDLKIEDLPPQIENETSALREFRLKRKGGKEVTVYVPNALIDETRWYVLTQRPRPKKLKERRIFLGNNRAAFSRQYVSAVFRAVADKCGYDLCFHHMRHTFAVMTLLLLQRTSCTRDLSINPLKTVQVLMGHSSVATTEIYLRALDMHSPAVEEVLSYLYGDVL